MSQKQNIDINVSSLRGLKDVQGRQGDQGLHCKQNTALNITSNNERQCKIQNVFEN